MLRQIILTEDGSHTIAVPGQNITYHSIHGAVQESRHVFIEAGLRFVFSRFKQAGGIEIFEMGFGTGLNALLTALEAAQTGRPVHYTAIEPYPLTPDEYSHLNYAEILPCDKVILQQLHQCNWHETAIINNFFSLQKENVSLINYTADQRFHLIYYDAFAPAVQPELWTRSVFEKLYHMLHPNGILVTYCSKSDVRRAMMGAGFHVQKIPGPPGKREIVRAEKQSPYPI